MRPRNCLRRNVKRGFTLIELLVVMAIIGVLAAIVTGVYSTSQAKSRDAQRKSDLNNVAKALEFYYQDNSAYPADNGGLIVGCGAGPGNCVWGTGTFEDAVNGTIYFRQLPEDPRGNAYFYRTTGSGQGFQLFAHLENENDGSCINNECILPDPALPSGVNCVGVCNFSITSPNVIYSD